MKRQQLIEFEGRSVILSYRNKIGPQERSGVIYAVAKSIIVFWPMSSDIEIYISFVDINKVEPLIK